MGGGSGLVAWLSAAALCWGGLGRVCLFGVDRRRQEAGDLEFIEVRAWAQNPRRGCSPLGVVAGFPCGIGENPPGLVQVCVQGADELLVPSVSGAAIFLPVGFLKRGLVRVGIDSKHCVVVLERAGCGCGLGDGGGAVFVRSDFGDQALQGPPNLCVGEALLATLVEDGLFSLWGEHATSQGATHEGLEFLQGLTFSADANVHQVALALLEKCAPN